jgi:hypothetical protein
MGNDNATINDEKEKINIQMSLKIILSYALYIGETYDQQPYHP